MKPIKITENIWWVGVADWELRDFHGYETEKGSTYNAYLVKGNDKTVLFDTVKAEYTEKFIHNIKQVIEPEKIDYIVSNHSEMDHTGALPEVLKLVKPEKLFTTRKGEEVLKGHFHRDDWPIEIVDKDNGLDIGGKTIKFIASPMLHWPESMVSYIPEDGMLISNDIFGQHWATSERYDDEVDQGELYWQAAKYYANIFNGVSNAMKRFLDKLGDKTGEIKIVGVDHGLIWRKDIDGIMKKYRQWAAQETTDKAVVVFDTMWNSTAKMAKAIVSGLVEEGIEVKQCDLRVNHRSEVITEILEAGAVVVGSSVINKGILPKMGDFLTYMTGLIPRGRIAASFGSYGWNDGALKKINEEMAGAKMEVLEDCLTVNWVPTHDDLTKCFEFGKRIATAVKAKH